MKRLAGLVFLVLSSLLLWAQTPDCPTLTQQALDLSGVNQEIDATAQMFASDEFIQQMAAGKPDAAEFAAVFKPILMKNFDGPSLKKELFNRVVQQCQLEQMSQAVQQMQTEFVFRMLQLEAARYTPEGQEKIKKYMRIIQIAPPPDSQVEMADAFDRKAGITDDTVDTMLAVTRGVLVGAGAPDDIIAEVLNQRKALKVQIQNTVLASILSTYNGVSKPDLKKYGDELSSGPLKWYHDAVHKSVLELLEQRAQDTGKDIKAAAAASPAATM